MAPIISPILFDQKILRLNIKSFEQTTIAHCIQSLKCTRSWKTKLILWFCIWNKAFKMTMWHSLDWQQQHILFTSVLTYSNCTPWTKTITNFRGWFPGVILKFHGEGICFHREGICFYKEGIWEHTFFQREGVFLYGEAAPCPSPATALQTETKRSNLGLTMVWNSSIVTARPRFNILL